MKVRLVLLSLLGLVILLGLTALAGAEGTSCGQETVLVPDGRMVESTIPANTTFWFLVQTTVGRSYSVEMKSKLAPGGTSPGGATFFDGSDACSGVGTLQTRDTTAINPQMPANGARVSFTAVDPADTGRHRVRLVNSSGDAINYTIILSETTLFSPGWSTLGNFHTYWSFLNTTNATINGTLTLLDATGNQVAAVGLAILPDRAAFPSTITMGIAAGQAGTARFAHDGPPGAILAEQAITNFVYLQVVRFEPTRQ